MTYPVNDQDTLGIVDGLNYLLSGPAGLGQNFQGFADYLPAYISGTYRKPYGITAADNVNVFPPPWYTIPISISNIAPINVDPITGLSSYIQITFTGGPLANPPFNLGSGVQISGVTDSGPPGNGAYNGFYGRPYGIVECTTTYAIIRTGNEYLWNTYISGGTIGIDASAQFNSTDCNARVTIYGPTDQVFISAQLALDFTYTCLLPSEFIVTVAINRFVGFLDTTNPNSIEYLFNPSGTVSLQTHTYNVTAGTDVSVSAGQNIFTTVLDKPNFGYYWYICEVSFDVVSGDVVPGVFTTGLRSLTAQVIKQ